MRYAPDHNAQTREKILDSASALFREHGIHAVGLAKVMAASDLTVGTFYTHFDSKDSLISETLCRSLDQRQVALEQDQSEDALERAIRAYLSPEHRDGQATGCPMAALVAEVARQPAATREAVADHLAPTVEILAGWLAERRGQAVDRADATALFGLLVGTLQLARATPDRAASDAILAAGVRSALRLSGGVR